MAGLFGYCTQDRSELQALINRMGQCMQHLGWLKTEYAAVASGVGWGRIGLGLLNGMAPPDVDTVAGVTLWMCGEFYHQDARRAALIRAGLLAPQADDATLALQVYLHEGVSGLCELEGAFVLLIWDAVQETLLLVNDRYGLYPHYYTQTVDGLAFAPEIKALLAVPQVQRVMDETAIAEYVRFQQLFGQKTWLRDIKLLPPASILRYRRATRQLQLSQYWDWDRIASQPSISLPEAVEETARLFGRAIAAMTRAPLRVGVYLSGGLDGRTILGFIDAQTPATAITFGAPGCRDVIFAQQLARRAGRPWRWFPLIDGRWVREHAELHFALTEGMHSWMHSHGISTLAEARELIDVNLSGWDGGTIMGGSIDTYERDPELRHAPNEAEFIERQFAAYTQRLTWPGLSDTQATALFCDPRLKQLARESFAAEVAGSAHYPADRRADYFFLLQQVRRSTGNMIVFGRAGFEVRCPFFDYTLIDWIYSLPEPIRTGPALHRGVLTRQMPQLASIPDEEDYRLPHSSQLLTEGYAALRRVAGKLSRRLLPLPRERTRLYADYEQYLRTDLRGWAESWLFDKRSSERGLFASQTVCELWDRHLSGTHLWTIGTIAPLITIEQALRAFVD